MAWIEVHQSLRGHKKLSKLCELLNIKCEAHAIGHLVCLWLWALDNAPDGNLAAISDKLIANAAAYRGVRITFFVEALIESGFINEERALHDWMEYAGRLMDKRKANADRMRAARRRIREESEGFLQDACAARAGLPYPTVPNPTQPYLTEPDHTPERRNILQQEDIDARARIQAAGASGTDGERERRRALRAAMSRRLWAESLPEICREACGEDAESLVYWLLHASEANDDQICCALEYMRKRHCEDNLKRPMQYVKALIRDWKTKGLETREDIQSNSDNFLV